MNAVIDTNVLVSSLWSKDGTCANILRLILNYKLTVVYDQRIIGEYEMVLRRPKFGFTKSEVRFLIDFIEKEGVSIVPEPVKENFDDESDKKFYEAYKKMNCILITGNKKHFPNEKNILTPKEFIDQLDRFGD